MPASMATRLAGSSDIYAHSGRAPSASVNFVTSHDGFTLDDLVSYSEKQNEANGESNRDGESQNHSWNCGVEGPSDDPGVGVLRARQKRNLAATLLFSQGVPFISAGDELGRTQQGNNNAYCQDNELSWLRWELTPEQADFLEFVRRAIALRRNQPGAAKARLLLWPNDLRKRGKGPGLVSSRRPGAGRPCLAAGPLWAVSEPCCAANHPRGAMSAAK